MESRYLKILLTEVSRIFQTHSVLITGANGFLGKVVLALLLDRFPDLKRVYLLLRPRRGAPAPQRFEDEILSSPALLPLVEKLGAERIRDRVTVLAGDIGSGNCGLGAAEIERLAGNLGAILNCAGLVEFFPPVTEAFRANVEGARHAAELARRTGAALAHVSTCFVCGEADGLVEESEPIPGFYPHRKGPDDGSFRHEDEIAYVEERAARIGGDSRRLAELGRQRAEHWGWTNTYTYSKSLGEQIIAAQPELRWTLIRPAIIEGSVRFPFPGWIEGGRTAAPLVLMARGGLKEWPVRRDAPLDVVPVDLAAAATLAVTALLMQGAHDPVYQLGTAEVNPIRLEPLVEMLAGEVDFVTPDEARVRRRRLQQRIGRTQDLLAGVKRALDRSGLPGKEVVARWSLNLRARGLQASLREQTLDQYLPFILHNRYIFETANIRAAYARLSERDRRLLPWDPENIDWRDYWIHKQIPGIEKWIQPEAVKEWALRV